MAAASDYELWVNEFLERIPVLSYITEAVQGATNLRLWFEFEMAQISVRRKWKFSLEKDANTLTNILKHTCREESFMHRYKTHFKK